MKVKLTIVGFLKALIGDYNGVQVFLAPISLFYLIKADSLLAAGTSLLSFRIHFFPLLSFLIVLFFVLFMIAKILLYGSSYKPALYDKVIELNITVLGVVIIALIIYAITNFMAYFYGLRGTAKAAMYLLFKLYTGLIIIRHYLQLVFLQPYYNRGYGHKRALLAFKAWITKNKVSFLRYTIVLILMILAATRVYVFLMQLAYIPIIEGIETMIGLDLRFRLVAFESISDVFINVQVCLLAFFVSNLLFIPIMKAFESIRIYLIPVERIIGIAHAQNKK